MCKELYIVITYIKVEFDVGYFQWYVSRAEKLGPTQDCDVVIRSSIDLLEHGVDVQFPDFGLGAAVARIEVIEAEEDAPAEEKWLWRSKTVGRQNL